jgi:OmpA-OmpF porin, OOP family
MIWKIGITRLAAAFFAVCFCTPYLWASEPAGLDGEPSPYTWYAGARAGYTYKYNACADIAIECDHDGFGYGLFAGFKPAQHLAIEISATDLGEATGFYQTVTLDGEISTADVSLLYMHNVYQKVDIFARIGLAYWDGKITGWDEVLTDSGVRPVLGFGVQFPLFTGIDGRIGYQYLDQIGNHWMGYTDANFLSFSIIWKFPSAKKSISATRQEPRLQQSFSNNVASMRTPVNPI